MISPLLANVYLHWFERAFHGPAGPAQWANARIVRYADDFVVLAKWMTPRLVQWLESQLEGRFRLTINREKTRIVRLSRPGTSLDFLGFTLRYDRSRRDRDRRYLNVVPSRKSLARLRARLRELVSPQQCWQPTPVLVEALNQYLRGWSAYFQYGYPARAFHRVNGWAVARLTRQLHRRSQRRHRPPQGLSTYAHLQALGLLTLRWHRRCPVHADG